MAYTRRQFVTCISIVYLIIVTALGGYAACRANRFSTTIPRTLSSFTAVLPVIAGLLLETGHQLTRRQERQRHVSRGSTVRPPLMILAHNIIIIYATVTITLLGTYADPSSGSKCALAERWKWLFSHKRTEQIRKIQDAFNCCGLVDSHDMAWPFPDKNHDSHACEIAFGRKNGCFALWRGEEQRLAGTLMAVVGLVFIWQFLIIAVPTKHESWLHQVVPDRVSRIIADEEQPPNPNRRVIDYLPNSDRYQDEAEPSDSEEESVSRQTRHAIGGTKDTMQRTRHDPLAGDHLSSVENEWSRS